MITIDDLHKRGFTDLQVQCYFPKPSKQKIISYENVEERGMIKTKRVITYVMGWTNEQVYASLEFLRHTVINIPGATS